MKEKLNNIKEILKENKKKVIIIFLVLIVAIISFGIYNFFKKNNSVYIEVASNQLNYIYGPNNTTFVSMKVGDSLKIKIIAEKGKKMLVKCQSNNENILKFKNNDIVEALNVGDTSISCKLNKNISNTIDIKVGD